MVLARMVHVSTVVLSTVVLSTVLLSTVFLSTVLLSTVLLSTVLLSTVLLSSVRWIRLVHSRRSRRCNKSLRACLRRKIRRVPSRRILQAALRRTPIRRAFMRRQWIHPVPTRPTIHRKATRRSRVQ
jgi:hypothetical protein